MDLLFAKSWVWLLFAMMASEKLGSVYSETSSTEDGGLLIVATVGSSVVSAISETESATMIPMSTGSGLTSTASPEMFENPSSTVSASEPASAIEINNPTETMESLTTGIAVSESSSSSSSSISSSSSAVNFVDETEIEKKADIELESETPVISFGIRSFTVEVGTGTERSSDEPVLVNATQPENATQQSGEGTTTQVIFSSESSSGVRSTAAATTVSTDSDEEESTIATAEVSQVETTSVKRLLKESTSDTSQTTVTINTKVPGEKLINMDDDSSEEQHLSNEIRVEKKNGLYRIKIAEITTDEFDNGLHESDNENMLMSTGVVAPKSIYPSKINIDDFYPSKLEDFKPPVGVNGIQHAEDTQEKLLREKAILRNNEDNEKLFESTIMKPSEVLPIIDGKTDSSDEDRGETGKKGQDSGDISTTKIEIELIDDTSETSANDEGKPSIDNITEKLEENDEVISRIEENFKGYRTFDVPEEAEQEEEPKQDDEVITIAISSVTFSSSQQLSTQAPPTSAPISGTTTQFSPTTEEEMPIAVSGSDIVKDNYGNLFIPRRVKKNDPTSLKLNVFNSTPLKKIDFANTKFNTDNSGTAHDPNDVGKKDKPEFSTTKFYNSKELYSELHHQVMNDSDHRHGSRNSLMPKKVTAIVSEKDILTAKTLSKPVQSTVPVRKLPTRLPARVESIIKNQLLKTNFIPREDSPSTVEPSSTRVGPAATGESTSVNRPNNSSNKSGPTPAEHPQDQQKKIKTLGAAASAIIAATSKLTKNNKAASALSAALNQRITPDSQQQQQQQQQHHHHQQAKPQPASPHPSENLITRPVITPLSRLQEKINTLDCDIQPLSPDSSIWRGNETHELELPITTPEDCSAGSSCTPTTISWEGTADIQSGDVLIVEIDDKHLIPSNYNKSVESAHHATTAVYQVTRLGHEHCDITEGVLLDITPLVVDGRKLVTLYDKDLTEGINLLIVVSEQWGQQCVRLKVTVKSDNCGENADCSGKGVCYSNTSMEGYECQCCGGFAGSHCEEIDACTPSPCTNNGICVDLSQGHEGNAYQCLCPYGYTGKNCQFESDPCNPSQCLNGGTCVGNSTHFRCECTSGYTGPLCQHNLNECESSPCVHGICVDQEDGFRCFCQPGFSGELCNFEYNECESNPCINGGQCIDNIGGFSCKCTRGYTGKRCHIKVDFCANDPCPDGHRCIDHGDDFSCECPGGRNGPDCNQVPRTLCNVNPCANGGTCWTTEESFYCACRPGFTGKMCEENFVIDTVVSSSEMLSDNLNQNGPSGLHGGGGGGGGAGGGEGVGSNSNGALYGDSETTRLGKRGSAIELHNAYIAAGTLGAAILIVAIVVTACHCKVHQSYRHFATKHRQLIPSFGRKAKASSANRHWLSGKGQQATVGHNNLNYSYAHQHPNAYSLQPERIINKPLPMNLENDMYYTVDFGESQNAPLIQ
ncbi:serine-rich adhesin for platelets-like [Malaya genurostris]|uniref:serine-rich adhesin for platelets-like n=1 Tax=Malaya genurostris TaxID=325434 RepID=UPI0026F4032D|nr:serine-rich adhesin for platelets-like [Malaya genurostris]